MLRGFSLFASTAAGSNAVAEIHQLVPPLHHLRQTSYAMSPWWRNLEKSTGNITIAPWTRASVIPCDHCSEEFPSLFLRSVSAARRSKRHPSPGISMASPSMTAERRSGRSFTTRTQTRSLRLTLRRPKAESGTEERIRPTLQRTVQAHTSMR